MQLLPIKRNPMDEAGHSLNKLKYEIIALTIIQFPPNRKKKEIEFNC